MRRRPAVCPPYLQLAAGIRVCLSRVGLAVQIRHVTQNLLSRGFACNANSRLPLPPLAVPLATVVIDPVLSGPKELEKVNSSVFAGLINAQQHQIITDATFS